MKKRQTVQRNRGKFWENKKVLSGEIKFLNLIGTIEVKLHVLEMLGKITRIIKPRFSTYMNGFIGVSGMEVIDKVTDLQSSYMPGINIKEELKNYTNQILDKMLKTITNEELEAVLCLE